MTAMKLATVLYFIMMVGSLPAVFQKTVFVGIDLYADPLLIVPLV